MTLPFTIDEITNISLYNTVTNKTIRTLDVPADTGSSEINMTPPGLQIHASDLNWIVLKESGEIIGLQDVNKWKAINMYDTNIYFIPTAPASDEVEYVPMSLDALNAAYKMYTESVINFINADNTNDGGDAA